MKKENDLKNRLDFILKTVFKPLGEKGEDALAYDFSRNDMHGLAVFDGCGGAGAWQYEEWKNATGAFVAAQCMAAESAKWMEETNASLCGDPDALCRDFSKRAKSVLQELKRGCAPMGIRGTLVKSFPCTASLAVVTEEGEKTGVINTLNIGDSRVYLLLPGRGLVQITKDDTKGMPDPLQSLRDSAPLSDMLNADKEFSVKTDRIRVPYPFAVLCATDGAFGFFRTPMDFEYCLLDSLENASSIQEFETVFSGRIAKITGDDSTCIMAAYGWKSFSGMQRILAKRYDYVRKLVDRMNQPGDMQAMEQVMWQIWEEYKQNNTFYLDVR